MRDWKSKGTNIDELVECLQYLIDVPLDYSPVLGSDDICGFDIYPKNDLHDKIFVDISDVSYNDCLILCVYMLSEYPTFFGYWIKKYRV